MGIDIETSFNSGVFLFTNPLEELHHYQTHQPNKVKYQ